MKLEAKIGLFVVMALGALLFLSTQVTSLGKWGSEGYVIQAYINDASGIEKHTHVLMNGVTIGDVEEITIEGKRVKLQLMIDKGVKIPVDSSVIVAQESLLGSKVLNITVGDSASSIADGGTLSQSKQFASFDQTSDSVNAAAKELESLLRDFHAILDDEHRQAIQEAIIAFRNVGVNLDGVIVENRDDLHAAIANFRAMGAGFTQTADTVNKDLPEIMARINSLTAQLDSKLPTAVDKFTNIEDNVSTILAENRSTLKTTLESAGSFFKSGEEAFGKVDSMLSSFTTSELQVAMHTDYMMRDQYGKVYLGVNYLPNPETYYMFDLISTDDYSDANNPPKKHQKSDTLYSLQYGKRFDNTLLRFGAIESTGGIGVDYFMNHDKLKLSAEAFDFNSVNDYRSERAHLKAQVRYQMLKHLELYGGWDDFLNPKSQNIFLGLGLRFIDNDLKYVVGGASSMKR
ncbi:Mammalian cell entry related domain protein [Sulfuricurvum kujiense DSM 16994]|uniref:Mammalian cell entry related domain protein n=1 Tax=Sulfuricurvum kujiense (strain ATCC BAA-921 / DSM 16994 / JCM 11577 / YK-1) TaxID=709032 RepID=E4TZ04_SULKY|nr:MlaD family protein [Sulfuricurvum kujiense]ADR33003.1 Mammalian cell entry related domain protein [Sulfuricurvum kujiense DSM 16994]